MTSPANHARDTIFDALQASAEVVALVPRLYPNKLPDAPLRPFGRSGVIDAEIERLSGWRGARCDGAWHVFVAVTDDIPDPESWCQDAVDVMAGVMDELSFCIVDRTMVLKDKTEADVYHGIVYYRFDAVSELN